MSRLLSSKRTSVVLAGGARVAFAQGFARVLDVLILVLFGRTLGPEGLGSYLWGLALVTVLQSMAASGMDQANVRCLAIAADTPSFARTVANLRSGAWQALGISAGIVAVLLAITLLHPSVVRGLLPSQNHTPLIVMALSFPLTTGQILASGATRGLGLVGADAFVYGVGRRAIQVSLFLVLHAAGLAGIWAAVGSFSGACASTLGIQLLLLGRAVRGAAGTRGHGPGSKAPLSRTAIRRYAKYMWGVAALAVVLGRGDRLVVTGALDAAELGLFLVALAGGQQATFFLEALKSAYAPRIASLYAGGDLKRLDRELKITTGWILYATLPILIVVGATAPECLAILGEGFRAAWPALLLVLTGQVVQVASGSAGTMLYMTGHQRTELWNLGLAAVVGFSALRLAATYGGLVSAAACVAVITGTINMARVVEVKALLNVSPISGPSIQALAASVGIVAAFWLVRGVAPSAGPWVWIPAGTVAAVVFMVSTPGRRLTRLTGAATPSNPQTGWAAVEGRR